MKIDKPTAMLWLFLIGALMLLAGFIMAPLWLNLMLGGAFLITTAWEA